MIGKIYGCSLRVYHRPLFFLGRLSKLCILVKYNLRGGIDGKVDRKYSTFRKLPTNQNRGRGITFFIYLFSTTLTVKIL